MFDREPAKKTVDALRYFNDITDALEPYFWRNPIDRPESDHTHMHGVLSLLLSQLQVTWAEAYRHQKSPT